jgi:hypothetical protein
VIAVQFPGALRYQAGLTQVDRSLDVMLESLLRIYARHFLDGWRIPTLDYLPLAAVAGIGVFVMALRPAQRQVSLGWAAAGVAIIGLGVALYLPTSLREETVRTYYYSGIGMAMLIAALVTQFRAGGLSALMVALLVTVGGLGLLHQHRVTVDLSERQQELLIGLTDTLPRLQSGTTVVVIDRDDLTSVLGGSLYLEYILPVIYNNYTLYGALCLPEQPGEAERALCRFDGERFTMSGTRANVNTPYRDLVVVEYTGERYRVVPALTPNGEYHPAARILPPDGALTRYLHDLFEK